MDKQRPSAGRACTLHLYIQDRFDSEIEALRRSDFELAAGTTRVRDAFDECSSYMLARVGDELVGAVRMTQPPAALRRLVSEIPASLSAGQRSPRRRTHARRRLATVARIGNLSTAHVCRRAALRQGGDRRHRGDEPFLHVRDFLLLLGFRDYGRPLILHDGPGCRTLVQCMELDLDAARAVAAPHMDTIKSRMLSKHVEVECGDQATSSALA